MISSNSSKIKGREMRWSPERHITAIREPYMPPSLTSLHLFCFLPSFFIGWWDSSGIKDLFFVS
jgi:hypothetical protein